MKIWIDRIELPRIDNNRKDSDGMQFIHGEMEVHYTAFKSGKHFFHGEFKCSYNNHINIEGLAERIENDLKNDPYLAK